MSCSPADFLSLATSLAQQQGAGEAVFRCVVSRAYYSALHTAKGVFPKGAEDFRDDEESTHHEVARRIAEYSSAQSPGHMYAGEIAKLLPKLRRLRNKADYYLNESVDASLSSDCIARARKIVEKCEDVERMRQRHSGSSTVATSS